jgi:hypothetical protein
MKIPNSSHVELQPEVEVGTTFKSLNGNSVLNLTGIWAIVNPESKVIDDKNLIGTPIISFGGYLKHAYWKYTQYCCVVNIRIFTANVGHRTFEGYWGSEIFDPSFPSSNTLELCANNVQDHGEYKHDAGANVTKDILSGCTKMTVDIIDNNHINSHNPAGDTIYLIRLAVTKHLEPVN